MAQRHEVPHELHRQEKYTFLGPILSVALGMPISKVAEPEFESS